MTELNYFEMIYILNKVVWWFHCLHSFFVPPVSWGMLFFSLFVCLSFWLDSLSQLFWDHLSSITLGWFCRLHFFFFVPLVSQGMPFLWFLCLSILYLCFLSFIRWCLGLGFLYVLQSMYFVSFLFLGNWWMMFFQRDWWTNCITQKKTNAFVLLFDE